MTNRTRWERPALIGLLIATGLLYLWGLGASGWANSFYSAAVQAGSQSWKAFFFGSSDAANAITVDKPPASLWVMALSVRVFGLSTWSVLVPQALMGVASVGVLHATVRRWFSPAAALLSGLALAVTPVATLMFRFNNPDALLVLLLTIAAYATVRAVEKGSTRWLVLVGVLVGFGFLTKMLQALLVVPAFALVFLVATPLRKRIGSLLLAGLGLLVSAGWWIAIVELLPARYRPYVGGSQDNSILELTLGYNGLGRLTGDEVGSVGGGPPGGGAPGGGGPWGESGWSRLFGGEGGGQIGWLLPAALAFLLAALWLTRKRPRTDRTRAAFLLWGGWLLVTGVVFSLMRGIFHAYYTVALAPAIAALVGMGAVWLWRLRSRAFATVTLAAVLAGTGVWSYVLLSRSADFSPWLRYVVLVVGSASAAMLLLVRWLPTPVARLAATAGLAAALLGPVGYSLDTAATPHTGSIVTAGPAVVNFGGFDGPGGARGGFRNGNGMVPQGAPPGALTGVPPNPPGQDGFGGRGQPDGQGQFDGQGQGQGPAIRPGGNAGGLLEGSTPSDQLVELLTEGADSYTWIAATVGSNQASGYQLASGEPVMAIGGFNGSDPYPTLEQFERYVEAGEIHYFIGGAGMRANSGSDNGTRIARWVEQNFTATTVGGITIYDLTGGASDAA